MEKTNHLSSEKSFCNLNSIEIKRKYNNAGLPASFCNLHYVHRCYRIIIKCTNKIIKKYFMHTIKHHQILNIL